MIQLTLLRRNVDFRHVWLSQVIGLLGASVMTVSAGVAVLEYGGNAGAVASILAGRAGGLFFGYLLLGALSAHASAKGLMIGADLARVGSTAVVAYGVLQHDFTVALVAVVITGLAESVFTPASRALVPTVVDRASLSIANSTTSVARTSMTIAGPAIGGVLLVFADPVTGILVNCCAFAASALFLVGLKADRREACRPALTIPAYVRSLSSGLSALVGTSWLWRYALAGSLQMLLGVGAWTVLGPVVVRDSWGASSFGLVLACYATGGLIGGLAAPRIAQKNVAVRASVLVALFGLALLGVGQDSLLACSVLCFVGGAGLEAGTVLFDTLVQQTVVNELIGRVSAIMMLPSSFFLPFSYVLVGMAADVADSRLILLVSALGAALPMLILAVQRSSRNLKVRNEITDSPA